MRESESTSRNMTMIASRCQKPCDYYDTVNQFLEKKMEQYDSMTFWRSSRKRKFDGASQWSLNDWTSPLAKGGGAKKRFQYCLNPNSSNHLLNLRAIQGHSGGNALDPELQDNVLLPEGFTEYIYHVGNASEMISMIRSGLIPGRRSLK